MLFHFFFCGDLFSFFISAMMEEKGGAAMDEMDEQEQLARAIRRAKLFVILPTALLMFLLAALLLFVWRQTAPLPVDDSLTPQAAAEALSSDTLLSQSGEETRRVNGSAELAALLDTAAWTRDPASDTFDAVLTIRFSDGRLLFFSDSGRARFTCPYPADGRSSVARYQIPANVAADAAAWISAHGEDAEADAHLFSNTPVDG